MPSRSRSADTSASTYSWFGPPRPRPRTVTVSSPPDRIASFRRAAMRFARQLRVRCCHLARFALELAEVHHLEARSFRRRDRGIERVARPRDQREARVRQRRIAGLAAFVGRILQRLRDGRIGRDAEALQHGAGVGQRRRIGNGRPRGDHRRIVIRHVGNRERQHRRGLRRARQPPALDAREMLAHRVDGADRRARTEQGAIEVLLLRSETPAAGAIQLADPPPESSTSTRSSAVALCASCSVRSAARWLAASGTGCPASITSIRRVATAVAVPGRCEPGQALRRQAERVEIMPFRRRSERGARPCRRRGR